MGWEIWNLFLQKLYFDLFQNQIFSTLFLNININRI